MNFFEVADATYVSGWQAPFVYNAAIKGWPSLGDKEYAPFVEKKFAEIEARIKTPLAFALLAPKGWSGEHCWDGFKPKVMAEYGWMPAAWKESTHIDKTWVQLYMKELDRPALLKQADFAKHTHSVDYTGSIPGNLPYLGCSSFFLSFDKPNEVIDFPKLTKFYRPGGDYGTGDLKMEDVFTFVRCARPMANGQLAKLRELGFEQLAQTAFSRYLVRAKAGVGSKEKCAY